MSYSLQKLKALSDESIVYDLINDSCDSHTLYNIKLEKFVSFSSAEWKDAQALFRLPKGFTQLEHDAVWNKLKSNGEF